jgi:hypothetical protein
LLTDCQFRLLSFHQGSYSFAHRLSVQTSFFLSSRLLLFCMLTYGQFRLLSFHQGSYFFAHRLSVLTPFLSSRQLLLCLQIVSLDSCPLIKAVTPLLTDSQFRPLFSLLLCMLTYGQFRLLLFHNGSYSFAQRWPVQTPFLS